jgi:hypothetical protein
VLVDRRLCCLNLKLIDWKRTVKQTCMNSDIEQTGYWESVRQKRLETILGVWQSLLDSQKLSGKRMQLSPPLLNEVVEHYLADVRVIKMRYGISERIQLHKVAGLMTSSILRYRPVVPLVDSYDSSYELCANEILALYQGIAICGEYTARDGHLQIIQEDWFDRWFNSFLYLLHHRNYTAESVIFIYETLCCLKFPKNLEKVMD